MAKATQKTAAKTNGNTKVAKAFVDQRAMSADAGEHAVQSFKALKDAGANIANLEVEQRKHKHESLKTLTLAFCKAGLNDPSIDLKLAFGEKKDLEVLLGKLRVAIGMTIATTNPDGTTSFKLAPWTAAYFPQPGENPEKDPIVRKKETFRSNFAAQMKKAAQTAFTINHGGLDTSATKKDGPLLVTGKAVKEHFKTDEPVALNEVQKFARGDETVNLAKKPSYSELNTIGAKMAGVKTASAPKVIKLSAKATEQEVIRACTALKQTVEKLKNFGEELGNSLEDLASAIEEAIDRNGAEEAA